MTLFGGGSIIVMAQTNVRPSVASEGAWYGIKCFIKRIRWVKILCPNWPRLYGIPLLGAARHGYFGSRVMGWEQMVSQGY